VILYFLQILIFASLALSVYMIVVTLERCRSEKRYMFVYCIVTIVLYSLGYLIEISSEDLSGAVIGVKVMYAGGSFMSPLFFFFVADYCEIRIPKKYYRIPLLIIPVLIFLVSLTFDRHQLLYNSYHFDLAPSIPSLTIVPGSLYMLAQLYPVFCIALSFIVLVRSIVKQGRGRRLGLTLLLISAMAPLIANLSYVAVSLFFATVVNFTALVMILTNFIFYYNVVRKDMFDLAPKAHAITMDLIRDAFVVLDWSMAYTGSNKNAQDLFPALSRQQKGASIISMENWPHELTYQTDKDDNIRQEIEFTLPHKPGKTYSGWTNRIASESGTTLGWVVLIQDITEMVSLIRNIRSQRDEIAAMRDNLKEGIFLMNRDFRIQDSYSKAMGDVLSGKDFKDRRFTDLLSASYNPKDLATIADYFNMIMDKSAPPEMLEDMNPLGEFSYTSTETGEHKTLRCLFAPVDQGGGEIFVMGTIQDISAETTLKKKLAEEEERRHDGMRNLFEVMQLDQKVLRSFIEDTDYEFNRAKETLNNEFIPPRQKLIKLYQSIHAIKSNAVIIDLSGYGAKLHAFEEKIKALREKEADSEDIQMIAKELEKHIEGKEHLNEIVRRLKDFSSSIAGDVKNEGDIFLATLRQACERVANDENKKVNFTAETIDEEALNRGPKQVIKDILTQLIRNSVHHGIETPEERAFQGKSETGKITLSVTSDGPTLRIRLWDDGRGLDFDSIAQRAEAQGLLSNVPIEKIDRQFLSHIIFSPGFSTSDTESIHAGRGIGLNLVKDRLREVKGKVGIQSKKGQGLTFDIQIPLG